MKVFIKSWYRKHCGSSSEDSEEGDDLIEGDLLSDFEIKYIDNLDAYCEKLLNKCSANNRVLKKILNSFTEKEAFVICAEGKDCGALIYERIEEQCCVLYYYIEEKYRGIGLFSLMFDLFNRAMERKHIERVYMPFSEASAFIRKGISDRETSVKATADVASYNVKALNEATFSAETVYVL